MKLVPQNRNTRTLGRLPWLVLASLLLHVLEEWSRFPEWATRHFGTTSDRFFVVSHIPIFGIVAWVVSSASRSNASTRSIWLLVMIIGALCTNTLFHLGTTGWFSEYSPGLVTALVLYLPLAIYMLPRASDILGIDPTIKAIATGFIMSTMITASLAFDMPTL